MATIQDLDSYKEVFAKWETHLLALYCKPSSLAMFFGWSNVGRRASTKLVLNCKANKEGGKIIAPEALPSDDFQSQVRQPLFHHFGFGSLPPYLCI